MNNDLISREALKKKLKSESYWTYTQEYGDAIPVGWVMSAIDNAPAVEPFAKIGAICNENCGAIRLEDGLKKAKYGKYVVYDVDFLLDNLAREVNIMESARHWEGGAE